MRFRLFPCALAVVLIGCSPAPAPVSSAADDPSNPRAAEGANPVLASPGPASTGAVAVVYACPMHPEVTSDHAGHCPKCNMTLVRRP